MTAKGTWLACSEVWATVEAQTLRQRARASNATPTHTNTNVLWARCLRWPNLLRGWIQPRLNGKVGAVSMFPLRADVAARTRGEPAMQMRSLVSIVDDDESVRESLPDLVRQLGFAAQAFSSADAFLTSDLVDETRCLILDITMPGMSGPELQRELFRRGQGAPTIFITASADKTLRPRLLAEGAAAVLFKPFSDAALFDALNIVFGRKKQ
jgi:CheY-like chemotaxis protein